MNNSRTERVRYLLRVTKAILIKAEDAVQAETEYLRDELNDLIHSTNDLLEKIELDGALTELRDVLHEQQEDHPVDDG